jgi:hypothetical protein
MKPSFTLDAGAQDLLRRHADWWQGKGSLFSVARSAPLGDLWLPLADGTLAAEDMDVTPGVLDLDRLAGPPHEPGPLETIGDRFRTAAPYARVPWVEAILGTPIRATIQGGSMRTLAFIEDWAEWERRATHRDEAWLDVLKRLTELLVARSGGRYAVAQTLMRGPCDLAEAVLGPELLSFSLFDHRDSLRRFLDETTATFIEVLHAQLARIAPVEGGYMSPFGIWAPGTVVRTQCDATAFLSAAHYREWFLPYDEQICKTVDYSFIHLHSVSLHTVDALLSVERPHAIQVTLETSPPGPTLEEMAPIFRKILGIKPLLLEGYLSEEELRWLWDVLPNDGLAINARETGW